MSASIVFHLLAALVYGALGLWLWQLAARSRPGTPASAAQYAVLAVGIALHGAGLSHGVLPQRGLYLGWALAMSAAIWLGMVVFWLQSLFIRVEGLRLILLPAATVVTLLAGAFPTGHSVAHAGSDWLRVHLLIALTAYGLMAVAALHAVLMAALDRQLHQPVTAPQRRSLFARALDSMPPLLIQERLLFQLVWIGFGVLTLTVLTGIAVSLNLSGHVVTMDHKTVFTLLSWVTFGILLWGRHTRGWRGRTALRGTLTGFVFLLLSYTGSRFVLDVIL